MRDWLRDRCLFTITDVKEEGGREEEGRVEVEVVEGESRGKQEGV